MEPNKFSDEIIQEISFSREKCELAQRLMEIPTKERVELILGVLKETKIEEENEEKKQKKIAAIKKITAI